MSTSEWPSQPDGSARPRSRAAARLRGLWYWLAQWVLWDERPTAAQFRAVCDERDGLLVRVAALEGRVAVAEAEADAAKIEVRILTAVCGRNEERVNAETARYAAEAEASGVLAALNRPARDT